MEIDFCNDWSFCKEGEKPVSVDLPHDAMLLEQRDGNCRNGVNSGYFPGGKYVYEKVFALSEQDMGKSIVLHFEGVYQNCTVSVNGKKAGGHKYGYTAFDVGISDTVHAGNNTVTVHVDNTLEPNCRWYSGSGIYRPVQLQIRDRVHIETVHIETVSIEPARVRVDAIATAEASITVEIYDGDRLVASGEPGVLTVPDAKLWSGETPNLYTCVVRTEKDQRRLCFGIRKLEWSPEKGLCVNGQRVLLRGGCIHHDHGVLGACEYYDAEERRIRILKENGFNALRMAHNPASQITLDICDRLGMYVMNEAFDGWYVPKTYHDYARWFGSQWKSDLTAMVETSRNHPCVIMYSTGNEVSETVTEKGVRVCRMLTDFVHSLDDTRPVTAGINVLLNVYARMGLGVYKDKGEYKPEPLPEKGGYKEKKTGSAFFNAMAQKLGTLMFFMSKGKKGDKACFGAAKGLDILGLNYASSRYDEDVARYPDRMMVGSETMVADLPYNWERVKKHPQIVGDFVWSAWDYLGEACLGDWTYHSYKGLPLLAGQGMIDITGKPLAAMHFMQIVWGLRKEPFIGVRPVNHAGETADTGAWQFTNAIDSWSWQGYEGTKATVEVYADASFVRLKLNGREIGRKPVKKYRTIFRTVYQPGTLTAEALDEEGNVVSSHSLVTAGAETILTAKPEKKVLRANGRNLCYLPVEFTDREGNLKPYMEERIEIDLKGAAVLAGFGSALCKTDEVFHRNTHNAYRGRALAVLRAGRIPGRVEVTVRAAGLEPVTVELEVQA
ncbi:MAG: glycoside hydrolase family 2 protein [Lachnospiraceae bacterium]|nr:glycoside hydrolase family 2 protein [Lachnospiraceae bacterium]